MYFGTGKELRGGRIQGLPELPESTNCQNPAIARIARIAVIARIEKQDAGIEASVFLGCKNPDPKSLLFNFGNHGDSGNFGNCWIPASS